MVFLRPVATLILARGRLLEARGQGRSDFKGLKTKSAASNRTRMLSHVVILVCQRALSTNRTAKVARVPVISAFYIRPMVDADLWIRDMILPEIGAHKCLSMRYYHTKRKISSVSFSTFTFVRDHLSSPHSPKIITGTTKQWQL